MATILKDVVRVMVDVVVCAGGANARPDTTNKARKIRIVVEADNEDFNMIGYQSWW